MKRVTVVLNSAFRDFCIYFFPLASQHRWNDCKQSDDAQYKTGVIDRFQKHRYLIGAVELRAINNLGKPVIGHHQRHQQQGKRNAEHASCLGNRRPDACRCTPFFLRGRAHDRAGIGRREQRRAETK